MRAIRIALSGTALTVGLWWLAAPSPAVAQSAIEAAAEAHGAAEFERALSLLDAAEAGGNLTRDEVVALLYQRALSHYALGQHEQMELALRRLVTLEPQYPLTPEMPPELRETLERLQASAEGGLEVEARVERGEDEAVIEASVRRDVGGVVRALRTAARVGEGAWREEEASTLRVSVARDRPLEYRVEAIGPGGAVVAATAGVSNSIDLAPPTGGTGTARGGVAVDPAEAEDEGGAVWPWIAVGVGVLLAGGIAAGLLLERGSDETSQLSAPTVDLRWTR